MPLVWKKFGPNDELPTYCTGRWLKGESEEECVANAITSLFKGVVPTTYEEFCKVVRFPRFNETLRIGTAMMAYWVDGPETNDLGEVAP